MKKKLILLVISLLCMYLLAGCGCEHEWLDATCTTAKTCNMCGETEGDPAGHSWASPTCETAKQCKICHIEEGDPLGHTLGKLEDTYDIINCKKLHEQICLTCGQQLASSEEPIDSFVVDEMFVFSPKEFMERMESIAKKNYPNFSYHFTYNHSALWANVSLGNADSSEFVIKFFKDTNEYVPGSEADENLSGLWCVEVSNPGFAAVTELGSIIDGDILKLLYLTCDPLLSDEDYQEFVLAKITCAMNAIEHGEPWGYAEKNGLLYEFCHIADADLDVAMECILVYAANWL